LIDSKINWLDISQLSFDFQLGTLTKDGTQKDFLLVWHPFTVLHLAFLDFCLAGAAKVA
jgi:hypothetical protein